MQTTSALWKSLWASGNARLEAVAVIAGTTYTEITAPVINRAVMQNGLSIGNAVSATCRFTVRTTNTIPKSAQVQIKMRLTDGAQTSEWLPAGTFYVSHRTRDAVTGLITLECYDALLKANAEAVFVAALLTADGTPIVTANGEVLCYAASPFPMSMATTAQMLADEMGVTIDPSTTLKTGANYIIQSVENGQTIHDVLGKIAAANGGNWIITPYNTLKLVPVVSSAGAAAATENVVDVDGIVGGIQTSRTGTISGIRYIMDGAETVVGDESGIVIQADVTAAVAVDLAGDMIGMTYQSYSLTGAVYDPAAELGDYVRAGANGEVQALLCAEVANLGLAYRGDLSAPELGELADEYPYIGTAQKTLDLAMGYADNAAAAAAQTLDNTLTQQEIFDRLTDGGLTQGISLEEVSTPALGASTPKRIYLNVDYVNDGEMEFDRLRGGTLILGGLNNQDGLLQVRDADNNIIGIWNNNGVSIDKGSIDISTLNDGYVRLNSANALSVKYQFSENSIPCLMNFGLNGVYINAGENSVANINGAYILLSGNNPLLEFYTGNGTGMDLKLDGIYFATNSINRHYFVTNKDNTGIGYLHLENTNSYFDGYVIITGNLSVSGTKSRIVSTDQYSDRLLYCYETPSPMFGDVGEGVIAEDGLCYITIDPIFAQTISTHQYQVFLQKYGDGDAWVRERKGGYFIVQGTPGLSFGWEIKAKQSDFDQRRLDKADKPYTLQQQTYGADAAQYIENLMKERISK